MAKKPQKRYERRQRKSDVIVFINPGKSLHRDADTIARKLGLTLNEYVVRSIEVGLGMRDAESLISRK